MSTLNPHIVFSASRMLTCHKPSILGKRKILETHNIYNKPTSNGFHSHFDGIAIRFTSGMAAFQCLIKTCKMIRKQLPFCQRTCCCPGSIRNIMQKDRVSSVKITAVLKTCLSIYKMHFLLTCLCQILFLSFCSHCQNSTRYPFL